MRWHAHAGVDHPLLGNREHVVRDPVEHQAGGEEEEHHRENQRHVPHELGLHRIGRRWIECCLQHGGSSHHNGQDEPWIWHRQIGDPANPRRAAHFYGAQQHPIQGDEHRNLNHDRETATHRVDFFFAIDLHHFLLHLLRLVLQALAHLSDFWRHGFHFCHGAVSFGIEPIKSNFQHEHERDDRPAPVANEAVELVHQPIQWLGKNREPTVIFDEL